MNLGEEVILTLLWQSGATESATVCFVISLSICYWLFKRGVLHIVCVCVRERERERERGAAQCCVCVCVCVTQPRLVCKHIRASSRVLSVTRLCSPLGLELMVKLRTLWTVFTFILKAKARGYGKGRYISDLCLWCSANHNALGQLANQSRLRLSEGGTLLKTKVWERRGIEDLQ